MVTPAHGEKWGVLGGAFDPVHLGHITLASELATAASLSGVIFVPSYKHPFKTDEFGASFNDRVSMLTLATQAHESITISQIEREEKLSGFTIDMIRAIKHRYPSMQFYFLIGADNLLQLQQWHQPTELLDEVKILVGSRPGSDAGCDLEKAGVPISRIDLYESRLVDISSTEIRKLLKNGAPDDKFAGLLQGEVLKYIRAKGLYQ